MDLYWYYKIRFYSIAISKNFFFHSCDEDYRVLASCKRIKKCNYSNSCKSYFRLGAVVINDKNEILVIKEKISNLGYKLPGGHIDNSEMISTALKEKFLKKQELLLSFESIISLGHFYPHQFHKSNLYILCIAKPKKFKINIQDTQEILDAKWMM